ncbi:MAG: hypothetical protein KA713_01290 [Chryseotalea sp. WA131a]|nr:MAG: hypothetical protein KA713_01290 [Chryseotalea sp. WA131a]
MESIEIKGDWIGYYTFDNGYNDWDKEQRIPFRLTIERGIYEFVGRIFEEAKFGGIDDDIVIKGRQNGNEIEFTKYYTLEHYLDENNQLVSIESENPTVVHYNGKFDDSDKKFKGEWEIPMLQEDEDGVLHADNSSGHWVIWREG